MAICNTTKIFKGRSDNYGFFARMENAQLVLGRNIGGEVYYEYIGALESFVNSSTILMLKQINPELAADIANYYIEHKFLGAINKIEEYTEEEPMKKYKKLCELKVDRKDSLQELCYHLTANGYAVQTAVVWKEYPQTGIDYWQIAICEEEKK